MSHKTSQREYLRLSINEQLTSAGEEILCVLEKQPDVCVELNVRVFVSERLSLAAELMFNLFQREIETLETLLERRNKLLDDILQPHVTLHRAEVSPEHVAEERSPSPVQEEPQPPQDEEMIPSLVQEEPQPPQIKEEQEEVDVSTVTSVRTKTRCASLSGKRGGKILVHDGYRYQRNRTKGAKIYWRCWRKTCNAMMQTSAFSMDEVNPHINILTIPDHNHQDDGDVISTAAIVQRMTQAIENDPTKPVKSIYDEVVRNATDNVNIPKFASVRSKLNRKRASLLHRIPDGADEVHIEDEWVRRDAPVPFFSDQVQDLNFEYSPIPSTDTTTFSFC